MLEDKPSAETTLEFSDTSPVLTESNRKRVLLGAIIGAAIFLGLLVAIIVLVASAKNYYDPPKPVPKPVIHAYNPYRIDSVHEEGTHKMRVVLSNKRLDIENNVTRAISPSPRIEQWVKNTTENWEPRRLMVTFNQLDEHLLNVRYEDPEWPHWEVPPSDSDKDPYDRVVKQIKSPLGVIIPHEEGSVFEWSFVGKMHDLFPLMTTTNCRMQYYEKYIEFEARLQSDHIYGMGERTASFALKNGNYSLWNRDMNYEYGSDSEMGTYGSHPFLLNRLRDKKDFIGIFMRNSNAMLFSFWHSLHNGTYINYKMIGGIVDLYVIHEAEPDYILKKYHSLIGRPYLPPVWAMGLQQARRGYVLEKMKEVVSKYQNYSLPLDGIWADIDLNDGFKAFTIDKKTFPDLKDFVKKLHASNISFVAIANSGLKIEKGYKYYEEAIKQDCVIRSAQNNGDPYQGRTMAGMTVWLDFFTHEALLVWAEGMHDLKDLSDFDGVWISENEISNDCDGECRKATSYYRKEIPNPFHNASEFDYIQYRPTLDPLEKSTLPMAAYHQGDIFFNKQYYTHNLYGMQVTKATFEALYGIFEDKRFFVASRSTWAGSGKYGSHWLGDNDATWDSMIGSIPGMLNFNLFGIPHVGAPIGGVYGDTDSELLARWYELGCFYPLMLSYTGEFSNDKEAYANEEIRGYIKNALVERYGLIRFMYTQIFEAHAWGGAVVHPLFFEFPEDETTYDPAIIDRTFMWGKTLYVIPALIKGQRRTRAYLPNWRWYDLRNFEMVVDYNEGRSGDYYVFEQPLGHITVLIKGGSIFPYQLSIREARVMNVQDLKKIPALIVVAPDHTGRASGTMVVDSEGIRPHPDPMSQTYRHYAFTYMNQIFRINKLAGFDFHEEHEFDYFWELIILDVFGQHKIDFVCMMDVNMNKKELLYWHAHDSSSLIIHDVRNKNIPMFNLESIVWGTPEQHNFCKYQVHVSAISQPDEKVMVATLESSEQNSLKVKLDLKAMLLTDQIVSLQISKDTPGQEPWIVPDVVDEEIRRTSKATKTMAESGFKIAPVHDPFYFELSDPNDPHDFTLTTRNLPFVYLDNFIHIKFMANTRHIFGIGERIGKFELSDGTYSLFNYDQVAEETGLPPGNNMYGSHPFYLMHLHNPHEFAGMFFLNSNPMDVRIRHVGTQTQIDHLFIGGIIDAFFFQRGTVDEILRGYQYIIGRPEPLPYWAFGYHQSRWGYRDIEHLKDVVRKFDQFGIPLDSIWMDKDYMKDYKVFTIDTIKWHGLKKFIDEVHLQGRHFVAIVDPAIAVDGDYPVYVQGRDRGVYIHSANTKQELIGVSWPGYSVWVDFLNPAALKFWEDQLQAFYDQVPFDGLWLDMNEPSNFCDGECPDERHYTYYHFPLDFYDDLYYNPTHRPLEKGTISMEALHYGGGVHETEFNYHNLYGLMQSRATASFFRTRLHKRPFIISSSTFPGIGRYASHWLGDNYSSWHYMQYSIPGMLNFQLFGIPFVGADICGFEGNATVSLCSRWMQLGAFYPFMRNHNSPRSHPQEPYMDVKLTEISKRAILTRYSLIRYFYSDYMRVVLEGGAIIRPLLFDFPTDFNTYKILDETFMFGYAIKVTPVLKDNTGSITSYFPNHDWYELALGFKKVLAYNQSAKAGQNLTMACSLDTGKLNLHIRGGSIFAYQDEALNGGIKTITEMRQKPIKLVIVPDHNLRAVGYLFYDEDSSLNHRNRNFHDFHLELHKNEVKVKLQIGSKDFVYPYKDNEISQIILVNAKAYNSIQCAKVHDNNLNRDERLNVKPDGENVIFEGRDGYKIMVHHVDLIGWYENSDCQHLHLCNDIDTMQLIKMASNFATERKMMSMGIQSQAPDIPKHENPANSINSTTDKQLLDIWTKDRDELVKKKKYFTVITIEQQP
eukprot:TRINITY_DN887_c0_g1_i1.p1 TRINITY_DN887_c0_g1~~TRINITY_DN887_c0_g1_i1.p1  ORF type:complete len:1932 (-),score=137.28 TRINITY_DN887_c0_g1_i1:11681-17392(-)